MADNHPPRSLRSGGLLSVYMGDQTGQNLVRGSVLSGEAAYMEGFPNRQMLFAILFQKFLGVGR
jgi:hypothetical protein